MALQCSDPLCCCGAAIFELDQPPAKMNRDGASLKEAIRRSCVVTPVHYTNHNTEYAVNVNVNQGSPASYDPRWTEVPRGHIDRESE